MFSEQARGPDGSIKNGSGVLYSPMAQVKTGFVSPNETEFHFVAHTMQPDQTNFPPHTAWVLCTDGGRQRRTMSARHAGLRIVTAPPRLEPTAFGWQRRRDRQDRTALKISGEIKERVAVLCVGMAGWD